MPHAVDHHAILDRLAAMRGGVRNAFAAIDPARTAHLVIDMQNGFMEPGAPVEVPEARSVVDNINRVSAAVRARGGLNVFVQFTTPLGDAPAWPVFYERSGAGALLLEVRADNEAARRLYGTSGFEVISVRRRYYQPGDIDALVMRKHLGGIHG